MERVHERLYTGGIEHCFEGTGGWAVVHACRHPCYRRAAGCAGISPPFPSHLQDGANLYLDLVDAPMPLWTAEPFIAALRFAARHWDRGARLLFHCNQGISRGPALAMLFLAKRLGALPDSSFEAAAGVFERILPGYAPAGGIRSFLERHWDEL